MNAIKFSLPAFLMLVFSAAVQAQPADSSKKDNAFIYSVIYNSVPDQCAFPLIGFINHTRGNGSGANIGFINLVNGSFSGAQIGYINTAGKNISGIQTGFVNIAKDTANAAQIGFVNVSGKNSRGTKIGFVNAAGGDLDGAAIGFVNTAAGEVSGPQIGFVNISRKAKGPLVGFINIIDSLEGGVPVGFLSFVRKKGYHTLEFSVSEMFPVNLAYKVGVSRLYSIIQASADPFIARSNYGFSLGLGTNISMGKAGLSIEAAVNSKRDEAMGRQKFYYYEKLAVLFTYKAQKNISFTAGPSLGYYAQALNRSQFPDRLPDDFILAEGRSFRNFYQLLWAGGQAGIRVSLSE